MPKFPSAEWAELLRAAVNADAAYAEAARAWEGDVLLRVLPDDAAAPPPGIHLDLSHGSCRSAAFVADSRPVDSEFVFEASRSDWREVLEGRLEPVPAVLSGKVKVRGNLAKAMRFTKASGLLIAAASTVPTEF
jgi:putative sterol carrier protein